MSFRHHPIGLFDSGLGGLTVMREVVRVLPYEHLIYFGDTANLPYGNKSPEAVIRCTLSNADFFLKHRVKLLIVACFTASTHALSILEQHLKIPVVGVASCGLNELVLSTQTKQVALLATASTIRSGILQSLILRQDPSLSVFSVPCPLFVPFIEEGLSDHEALHSVAQHYLHPLKDKQVDTALLACTHYPLIRPVIQRAFGAHVRLIEPAAICASEVQKHLTALDLLNPCREAPNYQFYATDELERFQLRARSFLESNNL